MTDPATPPRITGTFLDEITHDIPTQNWGPAEFSHFMSPNSIYPAAHALYERYREWQRL